MRAIDELSEQMKDIGGFHRINEGTADYMLLRSTRRAIQELANDLHAKADSYEGFADASGDLPMFARSDAMREAATRVEALLGGHNWDDC